VWHLASSGQFCRWRDVTVDWSIRLSLEVTHGQPESEVCQTMVRELTGVFALTQVQNITHFRRLAARIELSERLAPKACHQMTILFLMKAQGQGSRDDATRMETSTSRSVPSLRFITRRLKRQCFEPSKLNPYTAEHDRYIIGEPQSRVVERHKMAQLR
jgi:hypothetical protein